MPGPGPRGPRQTYRTPCSSSLDPRKKAKSRAARGTIPRQSGTRSTRDGLSCGENRSAAGGTRARAARRQLETGAQQLADRRRAFFVCQTGMQTPGLELEQLEQQLTGLYVLFDLVMRKSDQIAYRPAHIDHLSQLEALVPGIRSPGLDSCKFVPDARQLDLAPGS